MSDPQTPAGKGYVDKAVDIIRTLTFTNVAVFAMLLIMIGIAAFIWKVLNDDKLLNTVTSNYTELLQVGDCGVARASPRGGKPYWFITYPYGSQGQDRWFIGLNTPNEPTTERAADYCKALSDAIEYAMDPIHKPEPLLPGSDKPMFPPLNSVPSIRVVPDP